MPKPRLRRRDVDHRSAGPPTATVPATRSRCQPAAAAQLDEVAAAHVQALQVPWRWANVGVRIEHRQAVRRGIHRGNNDGATLPHLQRVDAEHAQRQRVGAGVEARAATSSSTTGLAARTASSRYQRNDQPLVEAPRVRAA